MPSLQSPAHNTVNGVHYGVPYVWGPNILMYNTDVVSPAPKSWDITFEPQINGQPNPYAGKITGYDSPIFIADAAMYLMAHQPDLGITDPYELTSDQLDAAINLLKQQNGIVSKYWNVWSDEVDAFESGDMVAGTAWPANQNVLISDGKVQRRLGHAGRGRHGMGRHVDDVVQRAAPELHAGVDELHPVGQGAGRHRVHVRRDAVGHDRLQGPQGEPDRGLRPGGRARTPTRCTTAVTTAT